jgi:hypothetical protein
MVVFAPIAVLLHTMDVLLVLRWMAAIGSLAVLWLVLGVPAIGMVLAVRAVPALVLPEVPAGVEAALAAGDDRRIDFGACYREQIGAITHVHLAGDHVARGYAEGVLVGGHIARIETEMMGVFIERVPNFFARHLLLGLVNWNNRSLDSYFTADERDEIAAITEGHRRYHDPYCAVSPSYTRGLQYHALHDVSQYLIDNPLVHPPQIGCTAVAVDGPRSVDGHLLVGRLFDFEGGTCFDRDKVVYTVRPDGGIPFVSVAWGGMAGAVTGLNDAGLWVSINAAATDGQTFIGRPIVMVVRDVLEHCRTIEEALLVIQRAPVFVSDGVLLASGPAARAVIAEKGPHGMGVREMDDHRLVSTNHFLTPAWKGDQANGGRIALGTTVKRMARADQLLLATPRHDPASILAVLRDHRGAGDAEVGFGNRGTINAWIGAHLVVADVTAKRIWVCEPYHGLGRALAFGIDGPVPADAPGGEALPESPELALYRTKGVEYRALEGHVVELLRAGRRDQARPLAERLLELNPEFFNANVLAAQCSDEPLRRRRLLERALALMPAYAADGEGIRALLDRTAPVP